MTQILVDRELLESALNPDAGDIECFLGSWNSERTRCHGCGAQVDGWCEDIKEHKQGCTFAAQREAMNQLREALAQPQSSDEPVAEIVECPVKGQQTTREIDGRWKFLRYGTKLYAEPQPVEQSSDEVVLWRFRDSEQTIKAMQGYTPPSADWSALYTKPQPVENSSDEPQIMHICNGCGHAYQGDPPTSCDCMEGTGYTDGYLYTKPPRQEWVGLSDAEICQNLPNSGSWFKFARAIESALREKNGGAT